MMAKTKVCNVCFTRKRLSGFYRRRDSRDGRAYRCRPCARLKQKKYSGRPRIHKPPQPMKPRAKIPLNATCLFELGGRAKRMYVGRTIGGFSKPSRLATSLLVVFGKSAKRRS